MQRDAPNINKTWMDPPGIENKQVTWCGCGLSLGGHGPSRVVARSDLLGFSGTTLERTQKGSDVGGLRIWKMRWGVTHGNGKRALAES